MVRVARAEVRQHRPLLELHPDQQPGEEHLLEHDDGERAGQVGRLDRGGEEAHRGGTRRTGQQ